MTFGHNTIHFFDSPTTSPESKPYLPPTESKEHAEAFACLFNNIAELPQPDGLGVRSCETELQACRQADDCYHPSRPILKRE